MVNDAHRHSARLLLAARGVVALRVATRYPVRSAADALEPRFSVAVRAAFAVARKRLPNVEAAVKALESALVKVLAPLLRAAQVAGGEAASEGIKVAEWMRVAARAKLHMTFDAKNPRIAAWAKRYAADLVTLIGDATRDRLRDVVARHSAGEIDDKDYRDALEAAVGDVVRAQTIARTESMKAVHQGQREAWSQAVDDGLLDEGAQRVWIVTPDDKLCPICEPLDGVEADLDGEFADGIEGPPAHPNCRCSEGLA